MLSNQIKKIVNSDQYRLPRWLLAYGRMHLFEKLEKAREAKSRCLEATSSAQAGNFPFLNTLISIAKH